jgi:hypothetical protein
VPAGPLRASEITREITAWIVSEGLVQPAGRDYTFLPSRGCGLTDRSSVHVLVFPAEDVTLRGEIHAALADIPPDVSEANQIEHVQDQLRRWYRSIEIRPRDPLGGYEDDPTRVWYVYRDGRIRSRSERLDRLERLYEALAAARVTVRASERAIDQARDVARLGRYPEQVAFPEAFAPPGSGRRVNAG